MLSLIRTFAVVKVNKCIWWFLAVLLVACSREPDARLLRAEALMEERPDSALAILDSIDSRSLRSDADRAKYSLLTSIALDKNYIDTTTFSILQDAIDYYADYGSVNERLQTYYYQGRIFMNRGENSDAMKSFVRALDLSSQSTDTLVFARLLCAQSVIFESTYDFDKSMNNRLKAAELFRFKKKNEDRAISLLSALNGSLMINDRVKADSIINLCDNAYHKDFLSAEQYIPYRLSYVEKYGSKKELEDILNNLSIEFSTDGLLSVASSFCDLGYPDKAYNVLQKINEEELGQDSTRYFIIKSSVLEAQGNADGALHDYKLFMDLLLKDHYRIFSQKLQSSEERYKNDIDRQRAVHHKNTIIFWFIASIICLILIIILLVNSVKNRKIKEKLAKQNEINANLENDKLRLEAENLNHHISELENELESLSNISKSNTTVPEEIRKVVNLRINMLNSLLAGIITSNERYGKPYEEWVSNITADSETFMNGNREAFSASHPHFIAYLEKHNLTIEEINYTCLYALGLKGTEIGEYLKKRSHVNMSSAIRKKLGLGMHETNLGIYVRQLLGQI